MTISLVSVRGLLAATLVTCGVEASAQTLLIRQPSVSRDHIAFVYAGDI